MSIPLEPTELRGDLVVLEPLQRRHCKELAVAVLDGEVHALWYTNVAAPEDMP